MKLDQGFADALPYPDGSFDRVVSSLAWHHLRRAERPVAMREARRVLRAGGSFHLMDIEGAAQPRACYLARLLHPAHAMRDQSEDRLIGMMQAADFTDAECIDLQRSPIGMLAFYRAVAPA